MVLGEQAGGWFLTKKIEVADVASVRVVGELKHQQAMSKRAICNIGRAS
jgi:hypothetical protein